MGQTPGIGAGIRSFLGRQSGASPHARGARGSLPDAYVSDGLRVDEASPPRGLRATMDFTVARMAASDPWNPRDPWFLARRVEPRNGAKVREGVVRVEAVVDELELRQDASATSGGEARRRCCGDALGAWPRRNR